MKRTIVIGAAILILLCVVLAITYVVRTTMVTGPIVATSTDPFGSIIDPGATPGGTEASLPIVLRDGSTISIPDFTKDTQPEWASADAGYQVVGNEDAPYQVIYFPDGSGFLVSLLQEPLGQSRLDAETALRQKLRLTNDELCKLSSEVGTTISVNETYAGRELGLSFCPGSVKLP